MVKRIAFERPVNVPLLHAELKTALGALSDGVVYSDDTQTGEAILTDAASVADEVTAVGVIDAHDDTALSTEQIALAASADADVRAKAIPGWALWTEQQAIDYITGEVTDLASAKTVLIAMARIIVALRDAQWPLLSID